MSIIVCNHDAEVPAASPRVTVERRQWDWGDTARVPRMERQEILRRGLPGAWYANPCCKVHCPSCTNRFLFAARKCQAAWCRIMSRQFANGWRNMMRSPQSELERHATFDGILILDGQELDARNWNAVEELIGIRHRVQRRPEAFGMAAKREWNNLACLSQSELQKQLNVHSEMALYVNPGITVMGLPLRSFYREARRRRDEWLRYLSRTWGKQALDDFAQSQSWKNRMLIVNGTLAVGGSFYLPGLWPGRPLTGTKLDHAPFGLSTVPAEYLGLRVA